MNSGVLINDREPASCEGIRSTVCLVMIVKNEAAVIKRCLASVRPFIDYWVICDTGSNDNTMEIVRETLRGVPGELHEDAWVNFGHNRTLSISRAAGKADYHLLLDADMVLNSKGDFRTGLTADAYYLRFAGRNDYSVLRLVSDRYTWEYQGATHEYIRAREATKVESLAQITVVHHEDGGSRADKYQRDIRLLSEAHREDPRNARTVFYLAQSYRDAGEYGEALNWYFQRASMGGWDEEVWYSLYMIGWLQEQMGVQWPVCLAAYLQAFQFRPTRLEPVYRIAKFYREHQQYTLGLLFARLSREIPYPDDHLFIDRAVYEELLPAEYAICCKELGFGTLG